MNRDKTGFFRFEIGFFQGCVLSAILFDCVFNLLLDLLKPISETYGYAFKSCDVKIMGLAYADDESNVTKSPEGNQKALDIIDSFLKWSSNMRAKPEKCFSVAQKFFDKNDKTGFVPIYKEKAFSPFDPKLTISGQPITPSPSSMTPMRKCSNFSVGRCMLISRKTRPKSTSRITSSTS